MWRSTYVPWLERGLTAARTLGRRADEASLLSNLGAAYTDLGRPGEAQEFLEHALEIARQVESRSTEAAVLTNLGVL